jgi:hypothetical protein
MLADCRHTGSIRTARISLAQRRITLEWGKNRKPSQDRKPRSTHGCATAGWWLRPATALLARWPRPSIAPAGLKAF